MPTTYLISRAADPFFALGVGIWAYALYEREHPRRPNHALHELVVRRYPALAPARDSILNMWPGKRARVRATDEQNTSGQLNAERLKKSVPVVDTTTPVGFEKAR